VATGEESVGGEQLSDAHLPEPGVGDEGAVAPGADGKQRANILLWEAWAHQLHHLRHRLPAPGLVRRRRRHLGEEPRREGGREISFDFSFLRNKCGHWHGWFMKTSVTKVQPIYSVSYEYYILCFENSVKWQ